MGKYINKSGLCLCGIYLGTICGFLTSSLFANQYYKVEFSSFNFGTQTWTKTYYGDTVSTGSTDSARVTVGSGTFNQLYSTYTLRVDGRSDFNEDVYLGSDDTLYVRDIQNLTDLTSLSGNISLNGDRLTYVDEIHGGAYSVNTPNYSFNGNVTENLYLDTVADGSYYFGEYSPSDNIYGLGVKPYVQGNIGRMELFTDFTQTDTTGYFYLSFRPRDTEGTPVHFVIKDYYDNNFAAGQVNKTWLDWTRTRADFNTNLMLKSGCTASYEVHPTFNSDTQIIDKKYVDDLITGGTAVDSVSRSSITVLFTDDYNTRNSTGNFLKQDGYNGNNASVTVGTETIRGGIDGDFNVAGGTFSIKQGKLYIGNADTNLYRSLVPAQNLRTDGSLRFEDTLYMADGNNKLALGNAWYGNYSWCYYMTLPFELRPNSNFSQNTPVLFISSSNATAPTFQVNYAGGIMVTSVTVSGNIGLSVGTGDIIGSNKIDNLITSSSTQNTRLNNIETSSVTWSTYINDILQSSPTWTDRIPYSGAYKAINFNTQSLNVGNVTATTMSITGASGGDFSVANTTFNIVQGNAIVGNGNLASISWGTIRGMLIRPAPVASGELIALSISNPDATGNSSASVGLAMTPSNSGRRGSKIVAFKEDVYGGAASASSGMKLYTSLSDNFVLSQTWSSGGFVTFSSSIWVAGDASATTFTDRTEYTNDKLTVWDSINSMTEKNGGVDYSLLNPYLKKTFTDKKFNEVTKTTDTVTSYGRDLTKTVSIHNEALKDLMAQIESLKLEVKALKEK